MTRRGARLIVAAAVAVAAASVVLGLSLSRSQSHSGTRPDADVHLVSCAVTGGQATARGTVANHTGDTQIVDVLIRAVGGQAGTEIVVPAHGTGEFSVPLDGGHPPCAIERARVVQSVAPGTTPRGGPPPPTGVPTK